VTPISGSDFVREVSQAPSDVWVVVILYKDGYVCFRNDCFSSQFYLSFIILCFFLLKAVVLLFDRIPECGVLMQCIEELATMYPATKFVKIISTDCIPNYPDCNLPTLLVYNNGAVKGNYVGMNRFGRRCTPEGIYLSKPPLFVFSFFDNFELLMFFKYKRFMLLFPLFNDATSNMSH
jgi:hypothetical protein